MERFLGRQGLAVSPIGLGCMGMSQDYGPADDNESVNAIRRAMDVGVTHIDTSMSYGAGHNEELVGRAIAGRRDEVVLATKFGIVRELRGDPPGLNARPENIRKYCEASLARLGTDHLDLYYLHRVDPDVPVEESVGAMAGLVAEGKAAHLGLSELSVGEMRRAAATHPITAVQYEWSLWWREVEDDVVPRLGSWVSAWWPSARSAGASWQAAFLSTRSATMTTGCPISVSMASTASATRNWSAGARPACRRARPHARATCARVAAGSGRRRGRHPRHSPRGAGDGELCGGKRPPVGRGSGRDRADGPSLCLVRRSVLVRGSPN